MGEIPEACLHYDPVWGGRKLGSYPTDEASAGGRENQDREASGAPQLKVDVTCGVGIEGCMGVSDEGKKPGGMQHMRPQTPEEKEISGK